ncbi:UspA domain protein [Halobacterium hubeiense]|uniref:UspA domain protein n=1 Tax=Halobacterium hubeiense TaxID=1407499 RepID=A0A0U5CZZ7_9EURY|nr:universal stress protein [Halobacterium hubeiense]CQH60112.1 UspA domain protein [Halobacterium hubeiense]
MLARRPEQVVAVGDLLELVVVPVASEGDAQTTMDAVLPRVREAGGRVVAVHVVEKGGGTIDKASVEQREAYAEGVFGVVEDACTDAGVTFETDLRFDTDVVDGIFDAARDHDASAVAFTPREGNRWLDLLAGDHARDIVKRADLPVVVLPAEDANE